MKLIRFDAVRLPFQPLEKQVIYFDASPLAQKMSYGVAYLIDRHYDVIRDLFAREGLEFCFLPKILSKAPNSVSYSLPIPWNVLRTISAVTYASRSERRW